LVQGGGAAVLHSLANQGIIFSKGPQHGKVCTY